MIFKWCFPNPTSAPSLIKKERFLGIVKGTCWCRTENWGKASPQWRGKETFAPSVKTFNDQSFRVYQHLTLRGSNDVGSKESPAFVCFVAGSWNPVQRLQKLVKSCSTQSLSAVLEVLRGLESTIWQQRVRRIDLQLSGNQLTLGSKNVANGGAFDPILISRDPIVL